MEDDTNGVSGDSEQGGVGDSSGSEWNPPSARTSMSDGDSDSDSGNDAHRGRGRRGGDDGDNANKGMDDEGRSSSVDDRDGKAAPASGGGGGSSIVDNLVTYPGASEVEDNFVCRFRSDGVYEIATTQDIGVKKGKARGEGPKNKDKNKPKRLVSSNELKPRKSGNTELIHKYGNAFVPEGSRFWFYPHLACVCEDCRVWSLFFACSTFASDPKNIAISELPSRNMGPLPSGWFGENVHTRRHTRRRHAQKHCKHFRDKSHDGAPPDPNPSTASLKVADADAQIQFE